MQLPWMNKGQPFVPDTMMAEAEDYLRMQAEFNPREKGATARLFSAQVDFIAGVLARTDPSVTRDTVRTNVRLKDSALLTAKLINEPLMGGLPEEVVAQLEAEAAAQTGG